MRNILSNHNTLSNLNRHSMLNMGSARSVCSVPESLVHHIIVHQYRTKRRTAISQLLLRPSLTDIAIVTVPFDRHIIHLFHTPVLAREPHLILRHNTLRQVISHPKANTFLPVNLKPSHPISCLLFVRRQTTDPLLEKSTGPMLNDQDGLILAAY